jgi:hypothetical protein
MDLSFIVQLGIEESSGDVSINVDGELSWWVWVTEKLDSQNLEEPSEIDNENYVIISEENVIDGIASFIARRILNLRFIIYSFEPVTYFFKLYLWHF